MTDAIGAHRIVGLPLPRRVVINFLDLAVEHPMYALLEADVTDARRFIDAHHARTGEKLSFTGWLIYCLARAVDADKSVQSYRKGDKRLVEFDDVGVGIMIERQMGETRAPTGYVIRSANHKSFLEIHRELRAAQSGPGPQRADMPGWLLTLQRLPGPLAALFRGIVRRAIRNDPAGKWVALAGSVSLTSVGMFGKGGGWGIAPFQHTLCLIVGGIAHKPAVVDGRIEAREMLSLTVAFDHTIVDGAPAARFVNRLLALIEGGCGLEEVAAAFESARVTSESWAVTPPA